MAKYYGKGRKTMGKVFRTKKGRIGCYVYLNGRRVGFEEKPRYSTKNYDYPKRRSKMTGSQSDAYARANYRRG